MASDHMHEETATRRYVRWCDDYDTPLWPMLLAALVLFLLLIFAAASVQGRTQRSADRALDEVDAVWARARVSGRDVRLIGAPPNERAAQVAYNAVQNATARAWFFSGRQPARVIRDFDGSLLGGGSPLVQEDLDPLDWTFRRAGRTITLMGDVPDRATKDLLAETAALPTESGGMLFVNDNLTVAGVRAPEGHLFPAMRGIGALRACETAEVMFDDGVLSLICEADSERLEDIRERFEADLSYGEIGGVDISDSSLDDTPSTIVPPTVENIEACDDEMSGILMETRIQFETNSDVIDPRNTDVLDRVAEAAGRCPGTLQISGHTDNQGSDIINETLSQQRADAVRRALIRRGVPSRRLTAEGFGARVPLASNFTELGRARNRRIEIKVQR
ncbi:MAG: OmpA family protein [Pseudomonadota bacterium]